MIVPAAQRRGRHAEAVAQVGMRTTQAGAGSSGTSTFTTRTMKPCHRFVRARRRRAGGRR
eukprot:353067-Chlamydomonas_euryale.AAC.4